MTEEQKPPEAEHVLPIGGGHVIPNVQLEEIEKAVYAKQYEQASQLMLQALRKLKLGAMFIGYAPDPIVLHQLYSRFAAAVVTLMSDPGFGISQDGFDHFASEHAIMDLVFRASVFNTSDHMLPMISKNPEEMDRSKLQVADGAALVKFLLTYSLRSGFGLAFEETFRKNPQMMFSIWAGMISPLLTVSVQAQDRRELLLGLHGIFEDCDVPDAVLPTLSDAYMYTSYGIRRDKHDAKATIHSLFARMLNKKCKIPGAHVIAKRRESALPLGGEVKPTILICCEWFGHLHAMFRCYAPVIRQLRSKFRLVGMSRASDIDEEGKAEFDEWREVPADRLVLDGLVQVITSQIKPDIIYYPSLGMAMWWVMLASVRLAPIQVMTLGHPASSKSPHMDYVICERTSVGDDSLFTERLVEMAEASARYVARPDGVDEALMNIPMEEQPVVLRIAVPAMLCKLNATFMHTLREIARTPRLQRIEFHFFVNMMGVNLFQAQREISDWLPGSQVHARAAYSTYMQELRKCHLHLCSFPFGGTNSNIDSMMLGIPIVTLEGDEPHERFDAAMVRHAGLPEFLIAHSPEEYIKVSNSIIDDTALRLNLNKILRDADLQGLFFAEPPADRKFAFIDAMTMIYEQHEELQKGPRRITVPLRSDA